MGRSTSAGHPVTFGYVRSIASADTAALGMSGKAVMPGVEAGYLTGSPAAGRFPITIGAYSYLVKGPKGRLIKWLIDYGSQVVKIDTANPAFAGLTLHILLRDPGVSPAGTVQAAAGSVATSAISGPGATFLSAMGNLTTARDVMHTIDETFINSGGAADLTVKTDYWFPGWTPEKVIEITTGNAQSEIESAIRYVKTGRTEMNFSNIASWCFGS